MTKINLYMGQNSSIAPHQPTLAEMSHVAPISQEDNDMLFVSITHQVRSLGFIGVVLAAVLSGFGAINCCYSYFNFYDSSISLNKIAETKKSYLLSMRRIGEKKRELIQLEEITSLQERNSQGIVGSLFSWVSTSKEKKQLSRVADELGTLRVISQTTFRELDALMENQKRIDFAQTLKGKLYFLMAKFFACYCLYKIIISTINAAFQRHSSMDPINRVLTIMFYIFGIQLEDNFFYTLLIQQLSFLFVSYLITANIRSFLINLMGIIKLIMKKLAVNISSNSLILLLSEVMGVYFISTVLLMRASLPPIYLNNFNSILTDIDFGWLQNIFEAVFAVSAVSSIGVVYLNHKFNNRIIA
eukprot:CAMPEP_0114989066 /NCGR_PEP_ID=MMETSP0216-20121206/9977_1 /TAXON_ID=223996 /ORGANISM="Protocruzia adherens, Strain Boccale" /LENGTH=357 /DNA_ID=CAMNT_0002351975 /DNA_START=420 /DNA_END=1493 /DNA_ORIENTATION=-